MPIRVKPLVFSNLLLKKVREVTLQRERDRQRQLQQIHVDRQVQNSKDLEAMEKFRQGLLLPTGRCSSTKNYETVAMQKCISISLLIWAKGRPSQNLLQSQYSNY